MHDRCAPVYIHALLFVGHTHAYATLIYIHVHGGCVMGILMTYLHTHEHSSVFLHTLPSPCENISSEAQFLSISWYVTT